MTYTNQYTTVTREALLAHVQSKMSTKRFKHVLGVEKTAIALAEKYGSSEEAASIAALIHDYAKELPMSEMKSVIETAGLNPEMLNFGSEICHGPVATELAKKDFGITSEDILNAIRYHTVGAVQMSLLEKIIFVADFIEPGRSFPGVDTARAIANQDLDEAVLFEMKHTLTYLISIEARIYPETILAYNAWVTKGKKN
ncbi:bis(5'-nucleosyl)-tetraphosphatase (symmetrical) YqeK [Isobaculum melis]|nr:bis(5'-nucleosyl)-tetraphosphatase (symmetrical) YqeK [Isobaculum melis]